MRELAQCPSSAVTLSMIDLMAQCCKHPHQRGIDRWRVIAAVRSQTLGNPQPNIRSTFVLLVPHQRGIDRWRVIAAVRSQTLGNPQPDIRSTFVLLVPIHHLHITTLVQTPLWHRPICAQRWPRKTYLILLLQASEIIRLAILSIDYNARESKKRYLKCFC